MNKKQKEEFEIMVNSEEVAKQLSLSPQFIKKARKTLGLPHYKIGGSVRFRLSEVDAWLKQRKAKAS